jgi:hypothetical protein
MIVMLLVVVKSECVTKQTSLSALVEEKGLVKLFSTRFQ